MKVKIYTHSKANSEPCQTSKMELFAKLIAKTYDFLMFLLSIEKSLTIFRKSSILDI